jgi:hypothetical protein
MVVRNDLHQLREEENSVGARCQRDNNATAMATAIQGRQLGNSNRMTMMGQQQCDDDGWPATCRTLASAAPSIQGNNQLMWAVLGG